jgi:hypothetical protein
MYAVRDAALSCHTRAESGISNAQHSRLTLRMGDSTDRVSRGAVSLDSIRAITDTTNTVAPIRLAQYAGTLVGLRVCAAVKCDSVNAVVARPENSVLRGNPTEGSPFTYACALNTDANV